MTNSTWDSQSFQRVNYKNTNCIADHWAYLRKLRFGAPAVDLHMKIMQLNCKTPFFTSFFWPSPTNSACFLYILLVYFVTKGKFFFLFKFSCILCSSYKCFLNFRSCHKSFCWVQELGSNQTNIKYASVLGVLSYSQVSNEWVGLNKL